jgi:electron transfer flavoprotein beta subunit
MKIAVCVKAVPDAASGRRIDPASKRLDRSGELAISEWDTYAIEEALVLKEATGEGEVVVVSLGPERAVRALAGALEREAPDLTLFGQQSADGGGACLWAAVADRLRRPIASQVSELTVEAGSLTGKRQTEFGYDTLRLPLPAVVAVADSINTPRYPSLKGIMGAKKKPQERLAAADVGGVDEPRTTVLALNPPPSRGEARRIEDDGSAAEQIVEFLAERRLL